MDWRLDETPQPVCAAAYRTLCMEGTITTVSPAYTQVNERLCAFSHRAARSCEHIIGTRADGIINGVYVLMHAGMVGVSGWQLRLPEGCPELKFLRNAA